MYIMKTVAQNVRKYTFQREKRLQMPFVRGGGQRKVPSMTKSALIVTNIAIPVNKIALLVNKSALSVQWSAHSVQKKAFSVQKSALSVRC